MAISPIRTMLSLDRYARIAGIPSLHFNQAIVTGNDTPFPLDNRCSDVWYQDGWQNADQVSRNDLARAIKEAEDDITEALGFPPAPIWVEGDVVQYPRPYDDSLRGNGYNIRGARKSLFANYGKLIEFGKRATEVIAGAAVVTYSDEDNDGFDETATISEAVTTTDIREFRLYYAGYAGRPSYEIRDFKSIDLSAGVLTITLYAWQLITPELLNQFPTIENKTPAIDLSETGKLETTVALVREYTDNTQAGVTFYWGTDSNGLSVDLTTQSGSAQIRNPDTGELIPIPATYNAVTENWDVNTFLNGVEPEFCKLSYRAGDISPDWILGDSPDPLSDYWATTISWLATARLEYPFCNCGNVTKLAAELNRNLLRGENTVEGFAISPETINNPFGNRVGEIKAWMRVRKFGKQLVKGFSS